MLAQQLLSRGGTGCNGDAVNKPCTVYLGIPMTGYDKQEMIALTTRAKAFAEALGLIVWAPVLHENIIGEGVLGNTKTDIDWKWPMDKKALNNCFCFVNLMADAKSFGCEDEYGRHRYSEMQPSFKISPKHQAGYVSIANHQADGIFGDYESCFLYIANNFGTIKQRRLFKIKIFLRLPYWFWRQLRRLFQ